MSDDQPEVATERVVLPFSIGCGFAVVIGFAAVLFLIDAQHSTPAGVILGLIPGALLIGLGLGLRGKYKYLATGLLAGGCLIALIGGACGGITGNFTIR